MSMTYGSPVIRLEALKDRITKEPGRPVSVVENSKKGFSHLSLIELLLVRMDEALRCVFGRF